MAKTKRNFYFIGFGNMALTIYQRMDKSPYENIFLIEKSNQRIKEIKKMSSIDSGEFFLSHHTKIIKQLSRNKLSYFRYYFVSSKACSNKICMHPNKKFD